MFWLSPFFNYLRIFKDLNIFIYLKHLFLSANLTPKLSLDKLKMEQQNIYSKQKYSFKHYNNQNSLITRLLFKTNPDNALRRLKQIWF